MSRRQRAVVGAGLVAAALALLATGAPETQAPPRRWDCTTTETTAAPTPSPARVEVPVAEVLAVVAERRRQP